MHVNGRILFCNSDLKNTRLNSQNCRWVCLPAHGTNKKQYSNKLWDFPDCHIKIRLEHGRKILWVHSKTVNAYEAQEVVFFFQEVVISVPTSLSSKRNSQHLSIRWLNEWWQHIFCILHGNFCRLKLLWAV